MNKRRGICLIMSCIISILVAAPVMAATISDIQNQKNSTQNSLNSVKKNISGLESGKEEVKEEITGLDSQLVDLITTLNILEKDLETKTEELKQAQLAYDEAKALEEKQYEAMKKRVRYMYEKGDDMYLQAFLEAKSFADMLNKADYTNKIYQYDRDMLEQYHVQKEKVAKLEEKLALEKSEMEAMQGEYEEEKEGLEALITQKKAVFSDFDAKLAAARNEAKIYEAQIRQQDALMKVLIAEEQRKAAEAAARKKAEEEAKKRAAAEAAARAAANKNADAGNTSNNGQTSSPSGEESGGQESSDSGGGGSDEGSDSGQEQPSGGSEDSGGSQESGGSSGGGGLGQEIANYGCQFIGNPYVAGGTSLTEGADCSGFTMSVYQHFGISIPRTSSSQMAGGRSVSYEEAQPGDIFCYAGHVGIYIGNGNIVHASTPATGIKITNAAYRTILGIRRYW